MSSYIDLDPTLSPELQQLKQSTHEFARDVLRPAAVAVDLLRDPHDVIARGSQYWGAFNAAYARGYQGMLMPKELGGMGLHGLSFNIFLEELGWGSGDFAIGLAVAQFPFLSAAATRDMGLIQELVLPYLAEREAKSIGCWGFTEMAHGSDQFLIGTPEFHDPSLKRQLAATRDGDDWLINGEKAMWLANGSVSTHMVAYLTTDPAMGFAGGGVAFIPLNLPGVSKGEPLDKLGSKALNQGSVHFSNVRIPKRYMLVDASIYEPTLHGTLVASNAVMAAVFTGVARAAYEEALAYTGTRVQGGKPICEHQLVQKRLFDMFTRVETARALSRSVMIYNDDGRFSLQHAVAAKTYCTQAAYEVADSALQLFGGLGLRRGVLVEKLFRDTRASLIQDGTNDILALAGARSILQRGSP